MNAIRSIQRLNKQELEKGVNPEGSWHVDYRDTAFIYFGGLPFELSEGDIITIFSQFGEPVWVKLARDKETGKSRGFGWLKYEDQRSTDLAVDNLGGATIMGRMLRVDHARYKPRDDEDMRDNTMGELDAKEDEWRRKRRRTESPSESESEEERPLLPEEIELSKLIRELDEDDPMKPYMIQKQQQKVDAAVKKMERSKRKETGRKHHPRRHHSDGLSPPDRERRRTKRDGSRDPDVERRRIKDKGDTDDNYPRSRRRDRSRSRERPSIRRPVRDRESSDDDRLQSRRKHRSRSPNRRRRHDKNEDDDRRYKSKGRAHSRERVRRQHIDNEEDDKYSKSERSSRRENSRENIDRQRHKSDD